MPKQSLTDLRPLTPLSVIEVRSSPIHGLGSFAAVNFVEGKSIAVYEGRRYTSHQTCPIWDGKAIYLFALSDGSFIDGRIGGNATRHINHSCSPNVIALEDAGRRGRLVVSVVAKRAISMGEELLLDYALDVNGDDPASHPCSCGDEVCRGSMAAL